MVVFFVAPMVRVAQLSLNSSEILPADLQAAPAGNYLYFFQQEYYREALFRTVRVAFGSVMLAFVLGYPTAYLLRRSPTWAGSLLLLPLTFPILAGTVVMVLGWMVILSGNGPVNGALRLLGAEPVRFLGTELGTVVALAHFLLPFVAINIYNSLVRIDPALEAAAMSLGAGPLDTFISVIWPLSLPGVLSASLLAFSLAMSAFVTHAYIMGEVRLVITTLINQLLITAFNWEMASTAAIILLILSVAILLVYNRLVGRAIR